MSTDTSVESRSICRPIYRSRGAQNTHDPIYLYAKNLQQPKYRELLETFAPISEEVGYDVIEESNEEIIPLEGLDDNNQKIVIFDDFVCERNQKPLVDCFISGRHKKL